MNIAVIYLAAGSGRRFGSNKLLCPLEGKPLYLHGLEKLICVCGRRRGRRLCVVTCHQEILDMLKYLPVSAVDSPHSERGIGWSVRAGVKWAQRGRAFSPAQKADGSDTFEAAQRQGGLGPADACAFFVGDQPRLSEETMERFLCQMETERADLGCVCCGGHMGNPTWFSSAWFPQLLALDGDVGGRKILRQHPDRVCLCPVEDLAELKDMDRPEDFPV